MSFVLKICDKYVYCFFLKYSMNLVEKYIFSQLLKNSILILLLIISLFSLSKSVQLIDLIINRGLPSIFFIKLILLSLPQIIPVLLPIIVSLSVFFVFSRMKSDNELIILQSSGLTPSKLIKPVIMFSLSFGLISLFFTVIIAPKSNENFKILLYSLKNNYSSTLLQEGMFNTIGKELTIFVKERLEGGKLSNIFIHDSTDKQQQSTLIAKKGILISDKNSTKILLENGSQQFQSKEKKLSILYFDKYLLDINNTENESLLDRWKSPSERTMLELRNPDPKSGDDLKNLQAFKAEITNRFALPLNVIGFSLVIISFIISSKFHRTENYSFSIKVCFMIIIFKILSIIASNLSIKFINLELLNFLPFLISLAMSLFFVRPKELLHV